MKHGFILKLSAITLGLGMLCSNAFADNAGAQTSTGGMPTMQNMTSAATTNKAAGEKFLLANKTKPGVIQLADGLQYKIITDGSGNKPGPTDVVTVDYEGKLIDGTVFDSSYKRGQPASFPVNGVIPGWTEALQLMNKGSTWELYIPASLAYGDQGVPPQIGPGAMLIFKVHLIDIQKS